MPSLTAEQASEALSEIIQRMDEPETRELLEECRKHAAGDMEKIMQFIVPKVYEIQGVVMMKYGFMPVDEGFEEFAEALKAQEEHSDVAPLAATLKQRIQGLTTGDADEQQGQDQPESQAEGSEGQQGGNESGNEA